MMDEPEEKTLSQLDADIEGLKKFYWEQIERLEQRIENHEGLIAIMVQGYAELAATSEAVMSVLSENAESKVKLDAALQSSKEKFLEVLNSSTK
jgi:DNA-binding FrmR family transcriptional regulator